MCAIARLYRFGLVPRESNNNNDSNKNSLINWKGLKKGINDRRWRCEKKSTQTPYRNSMIYGMVQYFNAKWEGGVVKLHSVHMARISLIFITNIYILQQHSERSHSLRKKKKKEQSNLSFRPLDSCQLSEMETWGCELRMFRKWVKTSSWQAKEKCGHSIGDRIAIETKRCQQKTWIL